MYSTSGGATGEINLSIYEPNGGASCSMSSLGLPVDEDPCSFALC